MFEKLSMDSLTTTMTDSAYRLWNTAKGYLAADSGQDDKDNYQTKTQDGQDDEKTSASLLSTDQQDISWLIPNTKKLLMLASLGLAYYTHQASYRNNDDNHGVDISYAINGMDITSSVPFQTTSDWSFAIPSAIGTFTQFAMLYGASNLLSQSYPYNAGNLFIAPLSLMALSSFLPILPAQTIETEFFKVFGGSGNDNSYAIKTTSTGDIVVVGNTNSFGAGNTDALVAKFYGNGSLAWALTLGGGSVDQIRDLALTSNDDIVVVGHTDSFGAGDVDAFVAKLYANGSLAWARTLGGSVGDGGSALALTLTDDILVTGFTDSFGAGNTDALVAKFYANGSLAWVRTLGGSGEDYGQALALTSSEDIIVAGHTDSFGAGSDDVLLAKFDVNGTIPGCNFTRTIQPTDLNWSNITNTLIAPTFMSLNTTGIIQDWTNISTQLITPQSLNMCFVQRNVSFNTPSSTTISTSVVSSASNSLTSNISPSSSQGSANSLTGTSSSVFSASDISTSLSSTSEDAITTNNPSSASTGSSASQSSSAYSFNVSVSTTPITIEQGISTTLTSSILSISGNVPPNQVIYTIIGNNPNIVITVNGLEVTQFTQEDVEGNFVEISLPGVTCGDDYSNELQLEANIAGSNAPAQQANVGLVLDITTCSYAGRLSAFSYRDTYVGLGFWANNKPKERAEREARLIQSTRDNTVNSIRFRQ